MKSRIFLHVFLFFIVISISAQEIKVLSSDNNSIVIEYKPIYRDTLQINIGNDTYYSFDIDDLILENEFSYGQASDFSRKINLGVPSEFGNTIQVLSSDYSILTGNLVPVTNSIEEEDSQNSRVITEEYSSAVETDPVTFGNFGYIRALAVQTINIKPIQFDASSRTIKLYNNIVFKIDYGAPQYSVSKMKDELVRHSLINYKAAQNWFKAETKSLKRSTPSLLAQGTWYKFEAPSEGIYKISATDVEKLGIDIASVDPKTIKVYGNGGKQLPESMTADRPDGFTEIAIKIVGEEDGRFDANDYILLYGRGTDFFDLDENGEDIIRYKHPFSLKNYYFITSGGTNGKRIQDKVSLSGSANYQQTSTQAFYKYEKDDFKVGETGRQYYDKEVFSTSKSTRSFVLPIKDYVDGTDSEITYSFVNTSEVSKRVSLQIDGNSVRSDFIYPMDRKNHKLGTRIKKSFVYGSKFNDMSILKFEFNANSSQDRGYLDFFEVKYIKDLKAVNDSIVFFSNVLNGIVEYTLTNFSNSSIEVYDISDYSNIKTISGGNISGGQFKFSSNETEVGRSKYISINPANYKSISNIEKVENSDIRGFQDGAEYIILATKEFSSQAERLKNYRQNEAPTKISTKIIYLADIYNEFSYSNEDPTAIRDFIKYAYENWNIKPKFLLLFGDGSYDYYNITGNNRNIIPTYQTNESLDEISSYPTDDYYVWVSGKDYFSDLAMGRFCFDTVEDAEVLIDKVISYETSAPQGVWRNRITLVADDAKTPSSSTEIQHTKQSEDLSSDVIPRSFDQDKIYLGEYSPTEVGSGLRKPEVNKEILNALNNGTLLINYTGHGSPKLWADERVFEINEALSKLENDKYFFLTAATCDYAYYDNQDDRSAAEALYLMKESGAIGTFAAARLVYSQQNARLNEKFYEYLFKRDNNGLPLPIGLVFMNAKNDYFPNSPNTKKYHLFADPFLRLKIPVKETVIDSVNGKTLDTQFQLKALSSTILSGRILNSDGITDNNFNGEAVISVFDSERTVDLVDVNYPMADQGGILFRGRVSVINGEFKAKFIMPKDISYENKKGKIIAYAFNENSDGIGFTDNVIVGGTDTTAISDKKGPELEIFFDDAAFENAYLVNPNFNLIVNVADESGLNTTGTGIGHKLQAILNDDIENPIDLTNYFVGDKDADGKSGVINYSFLGMEPGEYKIQIKAWDVYNNPGENETYFSVVNESGLAVRNVVNFPNPFYANTVFTFQHNLAEEVDVKIRIYTVAGRLIKEIEENNILEKFVKIPWDGRDEDGDNIANGTYLYKLNVKTSDNEYSNNVLGKLSVIR